MKIRTNIFVVAIAVLSANAKILGNPKNVRSEIEAVNKTISGLFESENVPQLIELYDEHPTFFPEFKPALFEREQLKDFYTLWFWQSEIKSYKKNIYEVESISNYVLEIGMLQINYTPGVTTPGQYNGTYMILWVRNGKGDLRILSEAFGADEYLESVNVPYAYAAIQPVNFVAEHTVSRELLSEIEAFNATVIKAVVEGDSDVRAKGFTRDGIYKPPFAPIKIGMNALTEHMKRTYKPGSSFRVKHNYYRIYDLGNYVFINGHYIGEWDDSINGGKFGGNMTNLMKRNSDGSLIMHRQLANREF